MKYYKEAEAYSLMVQKVILGEVSRILEDTHGKLKKMPKDFFDDGNEHSKKFAAYLEKVAEEEHDFLIKIKREPSNIYPAKSCKNETVLRRLLSDNGISPMAKGLLEELYNEKTMFLLQRKIEQASKSLAVTNLSKRDEKTYLLEPSFSSGWTRTISLLCLYILAWDPDNKKFIHQELSSVSSSKSLQHSCFLPDKLAPLFNTYPNLFGCWQVVIDPNSKVKTNYFYARGNAYEYGGAHPEVWPPEYRLNNRSMEAWKHIKHLLNNNQITSMDCSSFLAYIYDIYPQSTSTLMKIFQKQPNDLASSLQKPYQRLLPMIEINRHLGNDWDGFRLTHREIDTDEKQPPA
ncbi:MAG TPA: hypothetical protein QF353_00045 [Gammaproteobacteria bacterium]|nr:hypothetical protein [Gammaproteobacteria bacterium]